MVVQYRGREVPDRPEPIWLINPASLIVANRDGSTSQLDPDLRAGFEAYARRDLDAAIRALTLARAEGEMESMRRIYLGSALVLRGEFRPAVGVLRALPANELPESLGDETSWTLFVALSRAGDTGSADSLLTLLGQRAGTVGDRARRRLTRR